jgi:hypothetical protein
MSTLYWHFGGPKYPALIIGLANSLEEYLLLLGTLSEYGYSSER